MDNVGGVVSGFTLKRCICRLARASLSGLYGIMGIPARSAIKSLCPVGGNITQGCVGKILAKKIAIKGLYTV